MHPLQVGLVQIIEPMLDSLCLPYALGLLESYARAHLTDGERISFLPYVFERVPLAQRQAQCASLHKAHLVGFSIYTWNEQYSLALAKALKQANPDVVIVFGGPQVPDQAADYLAQHPFIDVCCHGPGEAIFCALLEGLLQYQSGTLLKTELQHRPLAGTSLLGATSEYIYAPPPPREDNLDRIPSPYLTGCFDPVLRKRPGARWVAPWETNRGCPFSCAFCDWGSLTLAKVYRFDMERVRAEIRWLGENQIEALFCCDANFGMLPRDIDIAKALAESRQRTGYPRLVYTQTTKNASERALTAQRILDQAGLNRQATLSVQTVSPAALQAIQRENISLRAFRTLQNAYRQQGMMTYTDFLVGLPGETLESFMAGVGQIMSEGQHDQLRLWNVYLLPNAPMSAPAYREKYALQSVWVPYMNEFGRVSEVYQPQEMQEMLVGSQTLPVEDWALIRHFAWLVEAFYYTKLLQVPIMWVKAMTGHGYHHVLQALMSLDTWETERLQFPLLRGIDRFCKQHTQDILAGCAPLLMGSDEDHPEPTWMPAPYFMISQMQQRRKLLPLQTECHHLLAAYLTRYTQDTRTLSQQQQRLAEAFQFGQSLWFTATLSAEETEVRYPHTAAFYQAVLQGKELVS